VNAKKWGLFSVVKEWAVELEFSSRLLIATDVWCALETQSQRKPLT